MKYEMFGEVVDGLQRIRALKDFGDVKVGDVGGWIENESNLSHDGDCWVAGNAQVFQDAKVSDSVRVSESARVFGNAKVSGAARIFDHVAISGCAVVCEYTRVFGNANVGGNANVFGHARVYGNAQVYGINRSDGYAFCYVPDEDGAMWVLAGCRCFTMEEARVHWEETRGGTPLGDETMNILDAIQSLTKTSPEGCV